MTIINTSPDRIIQLGYEGEDRVTVLHFRYPYEWLSYGEGTFTIRVRRHGESQAYNAQIVMDDRENTCLIMMVTNVELSVKGSGEMQVVYSGADFVKKSPIYSYNVSRAVDEAVDPPTQDIYTQIIESLSDLQTDVQGLSDAVNDIGNLADLTTTAKTDLVSAINEVNSKSVDDVLSATSTNPVQNKVLTARINSLDSDVGTLRTSVQSKADIQTVSALADAVNGLDSDVQGLQTAVQAKADTSTVTALSGTVSGLQTAVQSKADAQTVTALSGTVTDLQANKADKTYVDTELAGKASTAVATTSTNGLMSAQDKSKLDEVGLLKEQVYNSYPNVEAETASVVSITDGADGIPVKSLVVWIEPVQDLHGYDSPWPAGGGKNKYPIAIGEDVWINNGNATYSNSDGELLIVCAAQVSSGVYGYGQQRALLNQQSVTKTASMDIKASVAMSIAVQGNIKDVTTSYQRISVTIEANTSASLSIYGRGTAGTIYVKNVAITEDGSTAYSPYSNICPISGWTGANIHVSPTTDAADGQTYSVDWTDEAGTVYGGTLDVTTGVLTVDRAQITSYAGETLPGTWISDRDVYAAGATPTTGAQVVYELATPITYQLTPQEVSTLLGQNNIWADAGDTTVEYRANTSAYIAKKIAEAISALS